MKKIFKTAIKYISISLFGIFLFIETSRFANAQRAVAGIGGEAVFLMLPLIWWLIDATIKDFARIEKEQVRQNNAPDFPVKSEQKK